MTCQAQLCKINYVLTTWIQLIMFWHMDSVGNDSRCSANTECCSGGSKSTTAQFSVNQ